MLQAPHHHHAATQLEWADTEIREIQHAIRNTEDTVEIQLDLLRNRILRFELVLNIVASVISFGCLVTGKASCPISVWCVSAL